MALNIQQQYLQYQMQQWNSYTARPNGMWNIMPIFPRLLPGANLSHTGLMYPMNGNKGLPHLGSYHTPGLNKLAAQVSFSPPLSPSDIEEHPYEPLQLSEPSLPLTPLSPPHSPPLDLNDTKYLTPTGLLPTNLPTIPSHQPSLGENPFPFINGLPFPKKPEEMGEGPISPLVAALLQHHQMEEVPTRDANGNKLPRWMIKRSICSVCNKKFESPHKLKLHMYTHTGERPHMCATCGMKFARKFCYRRHLKTHTLVKPHKCTRCGRSFREFYDMETHLMTEVCLRKQILEAKRISSTPTGVQKILICKKCNDQFTSSEEFSAHMELHQPLYATSCHICRAKFYGKEDVQQHIREKHPGYLDNQETKTNQLDLQELQFNFQEQLAAFKEHPNIVYPDH